MVKKFGFTIIELLLVIVLIGTLSAFAIPRFLEFRTDAKLASLRYVMDVISTSLKLKVHEARLRCKNFLHANFTLFNVNIFTSNQIYTYADVLPGTACTTTEFPTPESRKIFDVTAVPPNPSSTADLNPASLPAYMGNMPFADPISGYTATILRGYATVDPISSLRNRVKTGGRLNVYKALVNSQRN